MFNSETLEAAIGMAFLFLSISLICTAANEWLEGIFKWRAMDLERALRTLLNDADGTTTSQLLQHPLLFSLFPGNYDPAQLRSSWFTPGGARHMRLTHRRHLPSYIPAAQFATALLDCVARGPAPAGPDAAGSAGSAESAQTEAAAPSLEALRQNALALASPHLSRAVLAALDHSGGDLARARQNIERWFNGTMDRASGWYKRRTQLVLFTLGLAIAAGMNVDALYVLQRLSADKALRQVIVKEAGSVAAPDAGASAPAADRIENARYALEKVAIPIGWRSASAPTGAGAPRPMQWQLPVPRQLCPATDAACSRSPWLGPDWLMVLCGWLMTAFAVMLGAPFWFDTLNKFMVIRSTVKPHEKSPEESSEDRQK